MPDNPLIESKTIYKGRIVNLSVDKVELPNGRVCELEMIRHQGAAAVVPVDDDRNVLLVKQYRYASGGWLLEVPAGKLDGGEAPEICATREVEEETGFKPGRLIPMGWVFTTPGFTDEKIWLFLARNLEPSKQELQTDEVLTVEKMPFSDAFNMALKGEIYDAKSVCALLRAPRFLNE